MCCNETLMDDLAVAVNAVAFPSCPDGMNAEMYSELVTDVATQAYQTYQEKYRDVINRGGQVLQYQDNDRREFRHVVFVPSAIFASTLTNSQMMPFVL